MLQKFLKFRDSINMYCYVILLHFRSNNKSRSDIPIYNYVSTDNPITYDELKEMSSKYGLETPSIRAVWYYSFRNNKHRIIHLFFVYFCHLLPALLVDTATVCIGRQPR